MDNTYPYKPLPLPLLEGVVVLATGVFFFVAADLANGSSSSSSLESASSSLQNIPDYTTYTRASAACMYHCEWPLLWDEYEDIIWIIFIRITFTHLQIIMTSWKICENLFYSSKVLFKFECPKSLGRYEGLNWPLSTQV